jgi:GT2 family glycosyltransferase/glycosyltransferase involved in cell wall biosynthesis
MATEPDDLSARLDAHLERRRRLDEELAQLGARAERLIDADEPVPWWLRAPAAAPAAQPPAGEAPLTVVVPVHNAFAELAVCLRSLARHTTQPASLLLIDDASTDPRIGELLEMAAGFGGVRVLRNVENMGFTATVNRALRSCIGDLVLLNSDTEVGPRWLEQLHARAYSAPDIGTVTPVSDNAGAFSVPRVDAPNPLPADLSVADAARLLAAHGSAAVAETPTGSGFCLYVKRAVIESVGEFDAEAFPRGYGEENDFCMRALRHGWRHVVDGTTFIHHERESSFGAAKAALSAAARARLDERHPDYTARVRAFVASAEMDEIRDRAGMVLERHGTAVRPRLLFVIHDGGGGAIATNLDLMRALRAEFDCFVFSSDRRMLRFSRVGADGELESLEEWALERAILLGDFSRPDYRDALRQALERCRPELVHVRHMFKHTLDAPKMAADRSIPVVMSIHDHYTICPTIHLLDNTGRYCGGPCSPGHGVCETLVKAGRLPPLKHAFVYQWREEMDAALARVDAFVTTSEHARDVHRRMLPAVAARRFELIEHGRDLTQATGIAQAPLPGSPVRILITGNLDRHKGADLVRAMRELDVEGRLDLHFLGEVPRRYRDLGTMHGAYERDSLLRRIAAIRPAFIGVFSVVAETYNHALTEAWGAGIPVLATDIGALGERIRSHGGGFLVPVDDPSAALRAVLAAADDGPRYAQEAARATLHDIPTVAEMTERYAALYRDVIDRRRVIAAPAGARGEPLGHGVWRMTAIVPGRVPSTYVRILRPYLHPEVEWKLRTRVRFGAGGGLALDDADLVLVQRHAVGPGEVSGLVDELRRRRLPLVLDLDDHLLGSHYGDAAAFAEGAEPIRILLDAAELVTVSTAALAESIGGMCRRVAVVPNQLDERLFLAAADAAGSENGAGDHGGATAGSERGLVRLVYAGSPSHAEELAFLRPVLERLEREHPGRFALDVVGGEPAGDGEPWYRRREVPPGAAGYPDYVALLRGWRPEWELALAPLLDTPFNRHKSDLKFLEYGGLGLPAIYSAVEPYASVGDGVTGLIAANDVEAWCEAIVRLSQDDGLRSRVRAGALEEIVSGRLLRQSAAERLALIGSVLEAATA